MPGPIFIKKPGVVQVSELFEGFRLCYELGQLTSRDSAFSGPLAVQLRAILTDKRRDSKALLLRLLDSFDSVPDVYFLPSSQPPETIAHLLDEAIVQFRNPFFSIKRMLASQVTIPVSSIPELEVVRFSGRIMTVRDIVEWKSNKYGGAHYADRVKEVDALAKKYGEGVLNNFLVGLSEFLGEFGRIMIRAITSVDLSLHLLVKSDLGIKGRQYLVTSGSDEAKVFWGLGITEQRRVFFEVRGLGGVTFENVSPYLIDFDRPQYIRVAYHLAEDFKSVSSIFVDGSLYSQKKFFSSVPLPLIPGEFSLHLNRNPLTYEAQEFSFCLGTLLSIDRIIDDIELADMAHHMKKLSNPFKCIEIAERTFGEKEVGERDIKFRGAAVMREICY